MFVYILIFIYLVFCSLLGKKNLYLFIIAFLLMLFIAGFRDLSVGTDTQNYFEIYELLRLNETPPWFTIEPGWRVLNKLAITLNTGYESVVFIASVLTLSPVFVTIWKYSYRPFVSVLFYFLLFFYFQSFNVTRQMIAIAFIFSGYNDYLHGRKRSFYVQLCVAVLFHYSALLALIFPAIFKYVKIKVSWALFLLPLTYVLGILVIPNIIQYMPLIGKYSVYLLEEVDTSFSAPRFLINCLCLFIILTSAKTDNHLKLFYIGIISFNILAFNEIAGRFALYFMTSQMMLFASINCQHKENKSFIKIATLLYGLVYLTMLLLNNNGEVLPYSNRILSSVL